MKIRKTLRRLWLLPCVAFLVVLAGAWIVAMMKPNAEARRAELKRGQRLTALDRSARKLRVGMTRAEAENCLGRPDNSDTEYVWFWVSTELPLTNKVVWVEHYNDDDGRFILFYGDKLVSPLLKNTEDTPWDYFQTTVVSNKVDFELLLGPRPRIITQ